LALYGCGAGVVRKFDQGLFSVVIAGLFAEQLYNFFERKKRDL
jgi:hypothetical protein